MRLSTGGAPGPVGLCRVAEDGGQIFFEQL